MSRHGEMLADEDTVSGSPQEVTIHAYTAQGVTNALQRREEMIHALRHRLAALEQGVVSSVEKAGRKFARTAGRKPRRKMSAARRAALKLHGQYLGHIRTLSAARRAKVKAIREKSGVRAAIAAAKRTLSLTD